MTQMRAMDAAFLAMERPHEPRHLGVVMLVGAGRRGALTHDAVRALVAERLPRLASARRVVVDSPTGLTRPRWRDVERVDLDAHVRHHTLPAGAGTDALTAHVAASHATPLDRRRPLWELHVVDGLAGDTVALYAKVHLAAMDDTTGVDLLTGLLDDDAEAGPAIEPVAAVVDAAAPPWDFYDRLVAPVADQVRYAAGFPGRLAGRAVHAVGEQLPGLAATAAEVVRRTPGLDALARLLPGDAGDDGEERDEHPTGRAPRLSFNAAIGPARTFAMGQLATADVLAVKQRAGTSFNEVVIATCTGALRRWLLANDELPTSPVVAIVPVLAGGGGGSESSHVAALMLALPTHVADPGLRLARTRTALAAAKRRQLKAPASLQQDVAMFAPPLVSALATRVLDALPHRSYVSPTVNLAVTNVPGPRRQAHLAGRPLRSSHPVLSVSDLTPLHIGVQPGPERIGIGAIACADHVTDLRALTDAAAVELSELLAAVTRSRGRGQR